MVEQATASAARQPKRSSMNARSHPHSRATISTGGAAKCVSVPPIDTLTNSVPSVAYFRLVPGCRSKNCRASSNAQIVIAAGSVMNDPSSGPTVRMVNHQAAGVQPPRFAIRFSADSAKTTIGRVDASAMITTTNIASVKTTVSFR